jgi:hypothetical protein
MDQAMFDDYRAVLRAAINDFNSLLNTSQITRRSKEGVINNLPRPTLAIRYARKLKSYVILSTVMLISLD